MFNSLNIYLKILFYALLFSFLFAGFFVYTNYFPKNSTSFYFQKVRTLDTKTHLPFSFTNEEIKKIETCDALSAKQADCYKEFFYNYNLEKNLHDTYLALDSFLGKNLDHQLFCHQINHAIGHSELDKNNGDFAISMKNFQDTNLIENIVTCGNGFIHGLVEQRAKGVTDVPELTKMFVDLCNSREVVRGSWGYCVHGVGHAAILQTQDFNSALQICNGAFRSEYNRFNCYTGIFMQMNSFGEPTNIYTVGEDGKFYFNMCQNQPDEIIRSACYFESSLQYLYAANKRGDFANMMKRCYEIGDEIGRAACIKNTANRVVGRTNDIDIKDICMNSTKNQNDRVYCVSIVAQRLSQSLVKNDLNMNRNQIMRDICKNLPIFEQQFCVDLNEKSEADLFLTSKNNLDFKEVLTKSVAK